MLRDREITQRITKEVPAPQSVSQKTREFLRNLSAGKTSSEIAESLKKQYPVKTYRYLHDGFEDQVQYISSHSYESTKGKPTVVILCGVFQEVREWPLELAAIAKVFDVPTVAVDYAALASKGIDHVFDELPRMLECFEHDLHAPRVLVGESLGGIVAQSIVFSGNPETRVKGFVLSHSIPPQLLDRRLYTLLKGVSRLAPVIPIGFARRAIDAIVGRAEKQSSLMPDGSETNRQFQEVSRIQHKENGALTKPRGRGYANVAVGAVDKSMGKFNADIPGGVALNNQDKVFGQISEDEWKKFHKDIQVVTLSHPAGHFLPGVKKEEFLSDTFMPLLESVLSAAVGRH